MVEAPIPVDEADRLASLRQLNVLDTPIEERFERITRLTRRLLNVPVAVVSLVDGDRQWFKSIQGACAVQTPRAVAFCGHAILSDEVMVVPDARIDPRFAGNPLVEGETQVVFYAGCPLRGPEGHRVGVLCAIDHQPRSLSEEDLSLLGDLAAITESELRMEAMSVTHREMVAQVDAERRRSMIDPVTRLWNRQSITEILAREFERARRGGVPLGVVMADIDNFKQINDRHGHLAGDQILRQVSRQLLRAVRPYDSVGRFGGDEFLLVLPGCPLPQLQAIAARLQQCMAADASASETGELRPTMSFGAASVTPEQSGSPRAAIQAADAALYRAKRTGRDRVVIAA